MHQKHYAKRLCDLLAGGEIKPILPQTHPLYSQFRPTRPAVPELEAVEEAPAEEPEPEEPEPEAEEEPEPEAEEEPEQGLPLFEEFDEDLEDFGGEM